MITFLSGERLQKDSFMFTTGDLDTREEDAHEEYWDADQIIVHESYTSMYINFLHPLWCISQS